jgi:hypothetical protein
MEEPEVPTEELQEHIQHSAHESRESWTMGVALTSAFFATFAAIASLMAGHHSNEAILDQMKASDRWAYYQAKGIKSAVLSSKLELLESFGKKPSHEDRQKAEDYKTEQEDIKKDAAESEHESLYHLRKHVVLARAVTMFQVGIAVAAISVLVRRRKFWFVSLVLGLLGTAFLIQGIFVQ